VGWGGVVGREEEEKTRAFATMRSAGWCGVGESADRHTHTHMSAAAAYTVAEGDGSHERESEGVRERGREIVGMNSKLGSRVLGIGAASPGELEEEVVSLRGRGGGFASVHTGEDVTEGVCAGLPAVDTSDEVMHQSSHTLGSQNRDRGGIQWYREATSSCAEEVILKSSYIYQVPPLTAAELITCDAISSTERERGTERERERERDCNTHCNTHYTATHTATHTTCDAISSTVAGVGDAHSHGDALQHTATHCNTLQHIAKHYKTVLAMRIHMVTHCNTLQHTATHCNTLQQPHMVTLFSCVTRLIHMCDMTYICYMTDLLVQL